MKNKQHKYITIANKKAFHDYFILDRIETGMVLTGTEIKSIRAGKVNLKDSYASIDGGELFLMQCHISHYECGNRYNHEPLRKRKLLVHKKELKRLIGKVKEKGLSLIPLKIYFKSGIAKLELATARGKKLFDKRQTLKNKAEERELRRDLKARQ